MAKFAGVQISIIFNNRVMENGKDFLFTRLLEILLQFECLFTGETRRKLIIPSAKSIGEVLRLLRQHGEQYDLFVQFL